MDGIANLSRASRLGPMCPGNLSETKPENLEIDFLREFGLDFSRPFVLPNQ